MRQWLQIIRESTIGTTPVADANNSIWVDIEETDPAVNLTPVMFNIRTALPRRGVTNRISGSAQDAISGTITTALYHEHANFWESTVFEPTVGASPLFLPSLPTVTINRGWADDGGTVRYEQYKRCIFSGFTLTGSNEGTGAPIRLSVNVIGGEYNGSATISPPACSAFPTRLYLWSGVDFKLDNVSLKNYIRSISMSVTHAVSPRMHANRYPDSYGYFGWSPSIQVGMDMFSHAYRTQFLDIRTAFADAIYATNNKLELTYDADEKVTFDFYNAMFSALDPQRPPGGDHTQNATIVPFYDCSNYDMTCTITNPA